MAQSIALQAHQNQAVAIAVAAGKSITVSSMTVGGGNVWPHILGNSTPLFRGALDSRQVQAIIDNTAAGKTAAVNFNGGTGKNHLDFT
jgi:hypothetical protein